jgi:hypothetical protein
VDRLYFIPSSRDAEVDAVCSEWEGTPYKHGKSIKGLGIDCIHFAAEVLDSLHLKRCSALLRSLPIDAGIHNRKGVEIAARWFLRNYPLKAMYSLSVRSGDILVLGHDSPSHLMIVGNHRLWHATPPGVCFQGLQPPHSMFLKSLYRSRDQEPLPC